jgi:hypothetical protein
VVSTYYRKGPAVPDEYVAMTLRMPRNLHDALRKIAFDTRTPISRLVVSAVQESVDNSAHSKITDGYSVTSEFSSLTDD